MSQDVPFPLGGRRVWVAGHRGMVGSALVRRLAGEVREILIVERRDLDLRRQSDTMDWVERHRPEVVFLAAGTVGGILANDERPADFIADNLAIAWNVIDACHRFGTRKLMVVGSSCVYPKFAPQPITEDSLLSGPLEPTNEWYAVAKIAGLKMAQAYRRQHGADFISVMPTNLYGPGDNFDERTSHVLPALIRKTHDAKLAGAGRMTIWGTGTPRREFLHVDDCADALVHVMTGYSDAEPVNVGSGEDITILELARIVREVVGFEGEIVHDLEKPDGTPRKLLSADKVRAMGWTPSIGLRDGIAATYRWYLDDLASRAR